MNSKMSSTEKRQCSTRIWDSRGYATSTCSKSAVVERAGKWFCKIHDPEYVKAKEVQAIAKSDAKWDKIREETALIAARKGATEGLTLEELSLVTPQLIRERILEQEAEEVKGE